MFLLPCFRLCTRHVCLHAHEGIAKSVVRSTDSTRVYCTSHFSDICFGRTAAGIVTWKVGAALARGDCETLERCTCGCSSSCGVRFDVMMNKACRKVLYLGRFSGSESELITGTHTKAVVTCKLSESLPRFLIQHDVQ